MKARPIKMVKRKNGIGSKRIQCSPDEATHIELKFPLEHIYVDWDYFGTIEREYPLLYVIIPIQTKGTREGTGNWTWNGSVEKPTIRPSILRTKKFAGKEYRCHCWVNDGKVKFLSDCSHDKANEIIDLLDIE